MPILFKCEHCRARLSISRKKAGKLGTCPKCGEPIHIPEVDEKPATESKPATTDKAVPERNPKPKLGNKPEHRFKQAPADKPERSDKKPRGEKPDRQSREPVAKLGDSKIENKPFKIGDSERAADKVHESGSSEVFPAVEVLPRAGTSAPTVVEDKLEVSSPHKGMIPSDSDERIFDITEDYLEGTKKPSTDSALSESPSNDSATLEDESGGDVLKSILLPRWIVYFQAGLIGVVAATFFVFGMMVGNLTGGNEIVQTETESFKLTGSVELASGVPDSGAVVIVLPITAKPEPRPEADPLHPDNFEPIDNPSLDQIRDFGGDVVRANRTGEFEFELQGPAEYYLLVISKAQTRRGDRLGKDVSAKLGRYFLPYEPLVDGKKIQWTKVRMTSDRTLKTITF